MNRSQPASQRLGLYVHLPFCPQRCPYCAFAVVTGREDAVERYVDSVCREIESWAELTERGGLDTIFLGGGTPTRLAPDQIGRILHAARASLGVRDRAEITIEANPTTADTDHFARLRDSGINRLSLGAQSFRDESLRLLGRMHSAGEAERAFRTARDVGFDSVSFDLIFAIPGALAGDWPATLDRALELAPDHLSAYALSVEEGTPFARRRAAGDLPIVDDEVDAGEYELLVQRVGDAGYEHYEISNFAREGHRSQHNWDCWTGADYIGVGLSAHSYVAGERFWNTSDLESYLEQIETGQSARSGAERLEGLDAFRERLWLELRTCEGTRLGDDHVRRLQSSDLWLRLCGSDLARLDADRLRLTEGGLAVADWIATNVGDLLVEEAVHVNE